MLVPCPVAWPFARPFSKGIGTEIDIRLFGKKGFYFWVLDRQGLQQPEEMLQKQTSIEREFITKTHTKEG